MSIPISIENRDLEFYDADGRPASPDNLLAMSLRVVCRQNGLEGYAVRIEPRLSTTSTSWEITTEHDGVAVNYAWVHTPHEVIRTVIDFLCHEHDIDSLGRQAVRIEGVKPLPDNSLPDTEGVVCFGKLPGQIHLCTRIAPGIYYVTTDRTSGMMLSAARNEGVSASLRRQDAFYPEPQKYAAVVLSYPQFFSRLERLDAAFDARAENPAASAVVQPSGRSAAASAPSFL